MTFDAARHLLRVVAALVRVSLMTGMQYRADFLFEGLAGLVNTLALAAPLWLVFQHAPQLAGWSGYEAALVLSLFLFTTGVVGGLVEPNLGQIVEAVRTGSFDLLLVKPADAQLLASLRTVAPSHVWEILASFGVAAWGLAHLPAPAPLDAIVALGMLGCGLASMYALWLLTISASFVFVRVDNLRFLLWSATDAGRWPITVFTGFVRWVLTIGIPVALLTSFPAMALLGRWDAELLAVGAGTALTFVALSRWVWVQALGRYTSASS